MIRISSELRDLAAASACSALLFATGALLPLIGPPAGFISATPLIWLAARHGRMIGLLGGVLATVALLAVLAPPVALVYAMEHALPAGYLGWRLRRGKGIVAGSAAAGLVVTALVIGMALLLAGRGQDPVQLLEQQLREGLVELGGSATNGQPGTDSLPALNENLEEALAFMRRALPALTLVGIFLECAFSSLLASRLLARAEVAAQPLLMTAFALPEWLVWVLIPALALCWAPQSTVATVALNVLLPLGFGYLLQGLSISLHLAARARLSRFARILFASSLVVFPWLLVAPLLLGLLDFRFGFRDRWRLEPPPQ